MAGERRPEQAQFAHLAHDVAIEGLVAIHAQDARHQPVLRIGARRIADRAFLVAQLVVEQERVVPGELALELGGHARGLPSLPCRPDDQPSTRSITSAMPWPTPMHRLTSA